MASYTVKSGDTLYAIAKNNGTTVDAIAKASGISNPNKLSVGQKLTIPSSTTSKTTTTSKNKTSSNKNSTKTTTPIKGVSAENSTYKESKELTTLENKLTNSMTNAEDYILNNNPITQEKLDAIGAQYEKSELIKQVEEMLNGQYEQILNRQSVSEDVKRIQAEIENREKFEYDVDNDQLFQQALASAMNSGKTAMQDTIGQASALTGGYGSTYATSAGNQTYNAFIEDAYNNLPQYYQMAMEAYKMEGEELYNQLGMYMDIDNTEYNRLVTSFNTGLNYTNSMISNELDIFKTNTTNLYNAANLELNAYNTMSSNLLGITDMYSSYYETKSAKEYKEWYDQVSFYNSDYWNLQNYNLSAQSNYLDTLKYKTSTGDTNMDGILSAAEKAEMNTTYTYDAKGNPVKVNNTTADIENIPSAVNTRASKLKTDDELASYLDAQVDAGIITESQSDYLYSIYKTPSTNNTTQKVNVANVNDDFITVTGDNFTVKYGKTEYKLENEGKVEDADLIKKLNSISTSNGDVFLYDGEAYVKYADGYFKIGAQDGLFGMFPNADYQNLIKALQK